MHSSIVVFKVETMNTIIERVSATAILEKGNAKLSTHHGVILQLDVVEAERLSRAKVLQKLPTGGVRRQAHGVKILGGFRGKVEMRGHPMGSREMTRVQIKDDSRLATVRVVKGASDVGLKLIVNTYTNKMRFHIGFRL